MRTQSKHSVTNTDEVDTPSDSAGTTYGSVHGHRRLILLHPCRAPGSRSHHQLQRRVANAVTTRRTETTHVDIAALRRDAVLQKKSAAPKLLSGLVANDAVRRDSEDACASSSSSSPRPASSSLWAAARMFVTGIGQLTRATALGHQESAEALPL